MTDPIPSSDLMCLKYAYDDGFKAGYDDKSGSPYAPGTPMHEAWTTGFEAGRESRLIAAGWKRVR